MSNIELYSLIRNGNISRKDGEMFYKSVKVLLNDFKYSHLLILNNIIDENDGELFYVAIINSIKSEYSAYGILKNDIIKTERYKKLFLSSIRKASKNIKYAFYLLMRKTITRDNELKEFFFIAIENASQCCLYAYELLKNEIIIEKDGEIFIQSIKKACELKEFKDNLLKLKIIKKI